MFKEFINMAKSRVKQFIRGDKGGSNKRYS